MAVETERKYLGADLDETRRRLATLGAYSGGERFEFNIVFDTAPSILAEKKLLRLRVCASARGISAALTWKEPTPDARDDNFKRREEIETPVGDPESMIAILGKLGAAPKAVYEKTRDSHMMEWPDSRGKKSRVAIELDITPFGKIIELEGDPSAIENLEKRLGLDSLEKSDKSYHDLHTAWRARNGLPPALDFVFSREEKIAIANRLGLSIDDLPSMPKLL